MLHIKWMTEMHRDITYFSALNSLCRTEIKQKPKQPGNPN